jgi:hypothetical protein
VHGWWIGAVEVGESCRLQVNRLFSCKIDGLECLRTDPSRLGCHSADIGRQRRNQGTDEDDESESWTTENNRAGLWGNQNKTDLKLEEWDVSSRWDVEWRNGTVEGVAAHLWAYGSGPKKTRQTRKKHNIQVSGSQNGLMKHDSQRSSRFIVRKPVWA